MGLTITKTRRSPGELERISLALVSDSGGDVSDTVPGLDGTIEQIDFVPSQGSGTQPTNDFDVTLLDGSGVDALGGTGADLANDAITTIRINGQTDAGLPRAVMGPHTLAASNMGAAAECTINIYFRR